MRIAQVLAATVLVGGLAASPAWSAPKKGGSKKTEPVKKVEPLAKRTEPAEQTEDDLRAKKLFDDGTRAFNLGEFLTAVQLYRAAYKIKPEPGLLYNIAQAYRLSNNPSNAVFFYRSFLRIAPTTPNRREIEDRIRKLEAQINEQKAPPNAPVGLGSMPAPDEPTSEPQQKPPTTASAEPTTSTPTARVDLVAKPSKTDDKPVYKKWWLWTIVGVGVVGVGLGLGLGLGLQSQAPSSHFGTRPVF